MPTSANFRGAILLVIESAPLLEEEEGEFLLAFHICPYLAQFLSTIVNLHRLYLATSLPGDPIRI